MISPFLLCPKRKKRIFATCYRNDSEVKLVVLPGPSVASPARVIYPPPCETKETENDYKELNTYIIIKGKFFKMLKIHPLVELNTIF